MPYTMKSRGTPKMQRAHFEAIAAVLASVKPDHETHAGWPRAIYAARLDAWDKTCRTMCAMLASTNPNFRRADFLSACGLEE